VPSSVEAPPVKHIPLSPISSHFNYHLPASSRIFQHLPALGGVEMRKYREVTGMCSCNPFLPCNGDDTHQAVVAWNMDDTPMKVSLGGTIIEDQHRSTSVSQKLTKVNSLPYS
jgi:hypothetical protein